MTLGQFQLCLKWSLIQSQVRLFLKEHIKIKRSWLEGRRAMLPNFFFKGNPHYQTVVALTPRFLSLVFEWGTLEKYSYGKHSHNNVKFLPSFIVANPF